MTQDPRFRADSIDSFRLGDQEPLDDATAVFTEAAGLTQVAQTLAARGGGALSVDLALDLVLNDVVEQARTVTGATGAAVAMFRDGKLTCRASSGENAPGLGVPVDASSGLAVACVSTGEIQQCQDTETDERVNAEACQLLGVRSMLIAPLVEGQRLVGLIEVFSPWPNAFGKREISALQVLAGRIAESNREAEAVITTPEPEEEPEIPAEPAEIELEPIPNQAAEEQPEQPEPLQEIAAQAPIPRKAFDLWGTVLVGLVISAALALGLVIGWRRAAELTKPSGQANSIARDIDFSDSPPTAPTASQNEAPADRIVDHTEPVAVSTPKEPIAKPEPPPKAPTVKLEPPPGGLIVTQNGRVVYRSPSDGGQAAAGQRIERPLIHKVEPEYPAEAKARQVEGPVVLDVQVLGDGTVGTIAVVSGDPLLAQSAINAVKQWRYQPQSADGQGVQRQTRVTVKFTLPQS